MGVNFLKKHKSNLILLGVILLFIIPQTGMPIKVFLNKLIAFSPAIINAEKQFALTNYNWLLEDLEGKPHNFSISKNKVVVVNIWATWCPPCVAEMPSFQNLYNQFNNEVDFYFVSFEKNAKLKSFLSKKGYHLPVYNPKSSFPEQLASNSLPTTFLISKEGKIVIQKTGAAKWDSEEVKNTIIQLLNR